MGVKEASLRIREAQPGDSRGIAVVQLDSWRTNFAGILPDQYLAQFTYDDRDADWNELLADPGDRVIYVAEDDGGEVVGFVCAGPEGSENPTYPSEIYAIHINRSYHRQSIGRRLIAVAAQRLHEQGYPALLLWVLADNPARAFYERLGGRLVGEKTGDFYGVGVVEVAYGWSDIADLCMEERAGEHQSPA